MIHLRILWTCMLFLSLLSVAEGSRANSDGDVFKNEFIIHIQVTSIGVDELTAVAVRYNLHHVKQVVPAVHVYRDTSLPQSSQPKYFTELLSFFKNQLEIEQIALHTHLHPDPEPVSATSYIHYRHYRHGQTNERLMNLVCPPYYDMGVETAWASGITGRGVVVGVVDVGVNTELEELAANIRKDLSYNFEDGNSNVEPASYPSYPEYNNYVDHGNRCSGLIAGVKGNNICSSGVAPHSSVAALKVFSISNDAIRYDIPYELSVISVSIANVHKLHEIDIYSNSWGPYAPFVSIDLASRQALKHGVLQGRHQKGSIYVFPAGSVGNGYANSIYTIAVGGLGVNGIRPKYTQPNACTLTSAYGEGSKLSDTYLVTASFYSRPCTRDFKGTSASTAIVAGIVALALQANEHLTWRDVQHLIVNSSRHTGLQTSHEFRKNGAGKYFHDSFGFGLLQADEIVKNAKDWKPVTEQVECHPSPTSESRKHRFADSSAKQEIPVQCCSRLDTCIHVLEHVVVAITFRTADVSMVKLVLVSPSQTESHLIQPSADRHGDSTHVITTELTSVNFWGENPEGTWIIRLFQEGEGQIRHSIDSAELTLYGTSMTSSKDRAKNEPSSKLAPTDAVATKAIVTTPATPATATTTTPAATASVTVTAGSEVQKDIKGILTKIVLFPLAVATGLLMVGVLCVFAYLVCTSRHTLVHCS